MCPLFCYPIASKNSYKFANGLCSETFNLGRTVIFYYCCQSLMSIWHRLGDKFRPGDKLLCNNDQVSLFLWPSRRRMKNSLPFLQKDLSNYSMGSTILVSNTHWHWNVYELLDDECRDQGSNTVLYLGKVDCFFINFHFCQEVRRWTGLESRRFYFLWPYYFYPPRQK